MVNYANGKVYRIVNDVDDKMYVGSTVRRLSDRWYEHRKPCRHQRPFKLYQHMEQLGVEHFRIELLEDYPCERKEQLHAREGHWIRELRAELNHRIAGRTKKQYAAEHEESVKAYKRQWREENKERLDAEYKEYYSANRSRLIAYQKEYNKNNLEKVRERRKKYAEEHKDVLQKAKKEWAENNKERVRQYQRDFKARAKLLRDEFKRLGMLTVVFGH